MEDQKSLQSRAIVGQLADPIEDGVDDLLPDGVMSPGVIIRGVLLPAYDLLGMVQLTVRAGPDLVAHGRFQVDIYRAGDVFPVSRLAEEGAEGVVAAGILGGIDLTVGLDAVFETVELLGLLGSA